jgi:hypothetical protein
MISVADPHQADADPNPDPASLINADPDSHQSYANTGAQSLHGSFMSLGDPLLLNCEPLKLPAFHFDAIRIQLLSDADLNPAS